MRILSNIVRIRSMKLEDVRASRDIKDGIIHSLYFTDEEGEQWMNQNGPRDIGNYKNAGWNTHVPINN